MAEQLQPLRLLTLGTPEVRLGENLVTFPTRKTRALLLYLAIEGQVQLREHLATLFWPESSSERSYANLRNTLNHLQKTLRQAGDPSQTKYLQVTHTALGLNPDANIELDLHTIQQAYLLARADRSSRLLPDGSTGLPTFQLAVAYQRGEFLTGFSLGDAPGFDDWAAIQREVWRRRLSLILDRLTEIQFANGDFSSAAETASRWIALDTLNEVAYRRKMRAHYAAGERGQALETYASCRSVLSIELGVEPEPDTEALAARIRTQATPRHLHSQHDTLQPPQIDTSFAFLGKLFAGRTSEFQALVKSYECATAGQPQLVVLRGEAGIGKTRLASKFLAWASAQGSELLPGSAFESGSHLPFQPLVEALRTRLTGKNSIKELLDGASLSSLSRLLPELHEGYPGTAPTSEEGGGLATEAAQSRFFEPFVQLTRLLANRAPLILFVDDFQWADSATLDLLQYATRRWRESAAQPSEVGRVLLLVSLRSEALHPMTQTQPTGGALSRPAGLIQWLERVGRELTPFHLELEPLGEQETVQMVRSILSPPAVDFAHWLYAETRGQPFYLMEILKDMLERRVLHPKRQAEWQWTFAVDAEHDLGQSVRIPSTVQAVIRSRLNRLSPNAFSLLASGAVLEQHITFSRLCAVSKVTEDLALPALDELISSRLLLEVAQPGVASDYVFVNDMLRDVVYTEAGDARRRLFHNRAMEILDVDGASAAVLAHHALAAGLEQAAFHHSLAAGQEAFHLSATNEAIVHFERARQLLRETTIAPLPTQAVVQDLYRWLSRAYQLGGQTEKALAIDLERQQLDTRQA